MENGVVKIMFIWSEENNADVFTKNTTKSVFEKHTKKFMVDVEEEIR